MVGEKCVSRTKKKKVVFLYCCVVFLEILIKFSENSRSKMVPDLKGERLAVGGPLLNTFFVHVGGRKPSDLKNAERPESCIYLVKNLQNQIMINIWRLTCSSICPGL